MLYEFDGFEWDADKAEKNIKKHGLDFNDAVQVFSDPRHVDLESPQEGELRYKTIGLSNNIIIVVIHTQRDNKCRIISMRKSRQTERRYYYDHS
ncbi:MAG: BrnT family toxin [Candidatus Margulisbacteria bacterium]|jgi:uncharacterized DUF497 family protein|nr:BrnT family toxin [Candidatus Margulisiibacteriota bacterium]